MKTSEVPSTTLRSKRGRRSGKINRRWAFLGVVIMWADVARAGSPFVTDDPGFPAKGWEIKPVAAVYERDWDQDVLTAPIFDLGYTVREDLQLKLLVAEATVFRADGPTRTGLTNTDVSFKYRLVDEDENGWRPGISTAPALTLPTGSRSRGIGDHVWHTRVPVEIGKKVGPFFNYAEVGYEWALTQRGDDRMFYGVCSQYTLNDKWTIGAEVFAQTFRADRLEQQVLANAGVVYQVKEGTELQFSIGRSLRDENGPRLLAQVYLQFQF